MFYTTFGTKHLPWILSSVRKSEVLMHIAALYCTMGSQKRGTDPRIYDHIYLYRFDLMLVISLACWQEINYTV